MVFSDQVYTLIESAERLKRAADLCFAKGEYDNAISTYDLTIETLNPLRGSSIGEFLAIKALANQASTYLKLEEFEKVVATCNLALTVPSVSLDVHLKSKLYHRKAVALGAMKKFEAALQFVDLGISLGETSLISSFDELREDLVKSISSKLIVPILPRPIAFTAVEVGTMISFFFDNRGDPNALIPMLEEKKKCRSNLDIRDAKGNNLLWAACQMAILKAKSHENPDFIYPVIEFLINSGSNPEQRFGIATVSGVGEPVEVKPGLTPLQMLAHSGAVKCAGFLLNNGASVHSYDADGYTPLIVACAPNGPRSGNNSPMVTLLIQAGSRVNHRTSEGITALSSAAQSGDVPSVRVLLREGADFGIRCRNGFSPVIWALIGSDDSESEITSSVSINTNQSTVLAHHTSISAQPQNGCVDELMAEAQKLEANCETEIGKKILYEILEDVKSFQFSKLILFLKHVIKSNLENYSKEYDIPIEILAEDIPDEINKAIDFKIFVSLDSYLGSSKNRPKLSFDSLSISDRQDNESDINSIASLSSSIEWPSSNHLDELENLIQSILPKILTKKWLPVRNDQGFLNPSSALDQATAIEKAMLTTLMTAAFGPLGSRPLMTIRINSVDSLFGEKPDCSLESLKKMPDSDLVWYCSLINEVEELIYEPLKRIRGYISDSI